VGVVWRRRESSIAGIDVWFLGEGSVDFHGGGGVHGGHDVLARVHGWFKDRIQEEKQIESTKAKGTDPLEVFTCLFSH
jgi:hypothetical protein